MIGELLMDNATTVSPVDNSSTTTAISTSTEPYHPIDSPHFCKWILYTDVGSSNVRLWDFAIFLPNLVFFVFLLSQSKQAKEKLRLSTSPNFVAFYGLVIVNITMSIFRCIVSMSLPMSAAGATVDKIFWVFVRFFHLSTEISVLVFGLAFGHLDSRSAIRRVLLVTSLISLAYSGAQGTLELVAPDERYYVNENLSLYSHGGLPFWCVTCLVFALVYFACTFLPHSPLRRRIPLPSKRSFYYYTFTLGMLNLVQAIGSLMFYTDSVEGLCIIDLTTYLYFSFFTPLIYWTFLASFFNPRASVVLFSYKSQMDEGLEEQLEGFEGATSLSGSNSTVPQLAFSSLNPTKAGTSYQRDNLSQDDSGLIASSSFTPRSMPS
ncbi:Transmembrane protein adipocyte-associated 1 -like protein [Halotydeus destructor]|nr:Transmembrane protein adipocyte-associated 1 -like protein [Halotydeus destructor]